MTPERRQRITDVCELAAQLRPEERESFVEDQCKGNEELLREVKSALPEYLSARKKEEAVVVVNETPPPFPPMQRIGRYEITGTIGAGGSGQVYSALDKTVGRVVAIKVLNAPGNPDLVKRFQAEAKTVANLHHKNIVTVHEYGEENGVPYLVMEYLDGTTLQELIRRGSLPLLEKLEIMSEVAEGLHYAHECGITHRDVKPANIMQLTDGSVKIMDFGIARLGAEGATRLTQTGLLIGSIMYMAPEQFSGTADAVTDVFSFGVTFYELLTGFNPYAAADPVGIIFKIANSVPPLVRQLVPECPAALEGVIARTLSRDRDARYQSLSDVLADTSGILSELRRDEAFLCYREAEQLFNIGQLDAAKTSVRKALRLDPAQEDARQLRTGIDEAVRRRDAAIRADALIGQAEVAVREQKFEEAGDLLDSIRELGATSHLNIQGRFDWATSQVERARRRERTLYDAERNLRIGNLTEAFRTVSEVLAEDPGSASAKELLQEIRAEMAAFEKKRRFREGVTEVEHLLENGLFPMALGKLDALELDFPDHESPENQELQELRDRASIEPPADERREQIAKVVARAESLIAEQEYDRAVELLETAVARLGDDFDLSRLLLQAVVARHAAAAPTADESEPDTAQVEEWRAAIGKLDQKFAPSPVPPPPKPPPEINTESLQCIETSELPQAPVQPPPPPQEARSAPPPEPVPVRRPGNLKGLWIALGALAALILVLVVLIALGPTVSKFLHRTPANPLVLAEFTGSRRLMRGTDYTLDLQATGGAPPFTWQVREGALPRGLSLNPRTGRILGGPLEIGASNFVVRVRDNAGQTADRALVLDVVEPSGSTGATGTGAPACKTVAFNMDQYGDLLKGELIWSGKLPAGGRLEIRNLTASSGTVRGDIFPKGVPIRITMPSRVSLASGPTAENCWDPKLVLENAGGAKSEVRVQWEVVQP